MFHVRNPHGTATFLVDGAVAGAWKYEDGRVTLDPWVKLDKATRCERRTRVFTTTVAAASRASRPPVIVRPIRAHGVPSSVVDAAGTGEAFTNEEYACSWASSAASFGSGAW